jgi:hypothetical protein
MLKQWPEWGELTVIISAACGQTMKNEGISQPVALLILIMRRIKYCAKLTLKWTR